MSDSQQVGGSGSGRSAAPPNQPTTSNRSVGETTVGRGRGRGRGRRQGRGRGRGRGEQADNLDDALHQIRAQRQTTQRRVAALPKNVRQELVARKREAHLERMLLPDAPPRKRQKGKSSPPRQVCIMVDDPPVTEVEPSTSGVTHSSEASTSGGARLEDTELLIEPAEYHTVDAVIECEASTSGGARLEDTELLIEPAEYHTVDAVIECVDDKAEFPDGMDIAANVVIGESSPSTSLSGQSSRIDVLDANFERVVDGWLQATITADSDDDTDNDDNDNTQTGQQRNAATEPACDSDLTLFQSEVLHREDHANDLAIRDLVVSDDCYTFDWTKTRSTFMGRREIFTAISGPTFDLTEQTRIIDVFDKMFDNDFIDLICTETNRNAEQKIALLREQNMIGPHSRWNRWTPTDRDEMMSFLAIIILEGLYPLAEEEGYFKFNGYGTMPYFAKIMSYNRFLMLKAFLHFVDNQTCQDTTRLCKIRPMIDYFNEKFSSLYKPSQEIAIDESLLKWHGRLNFAQKISSKAAQVGVKTYELCESSSGYLWKFFVYAGKDRPSTTTDDTQTTTDDRQTTTDRPVGDDTDNDSNLPNDGTIAATTDRIGTTGDSTDRPTNATAKIVYDLIEPLLHRGHTVIMDNFYNSPLLLRSLKRQKTDCYGTLRLNREFVPDSVKTLTKTDLRQGEVVATYCSDLAIMVWRDANIVSMISTYHNLQVGTQDKYNRLTYKPKIVLDYNKSMGGVDRKDQFLSAQPIERVRNKVWYKKLFRRLYNVAIFNCFVIFSSFNRKISHRQFRKVLAEDLLKRHRQIDLTTEYRRLNVRSQMTGQVTTTVLRRNTRPRTQARTIVESNHFPARTGSRHTVCCMCTKKTRTSFKCEECDVNLCIIGCFKAYHKP